MGEPVLKVERDGHVAVLTLNRPAKLNALSRELTAATYDALDELEAAYPDVRAVVLTGAGRGFCAGADVASMAANLDAMGQPPPSPRQTIVYLADRLATLPQAVIAAVNGVAAGAGLSLALACDIRVSSTSAQFACLFVKRALVPDTAASYLLPRIVGPGVAAQMAFTGRVYDASWALDARLTDLLVAPEELMPRALEIAREIAANPPLAVRATKQIMRGFRRDLGEVASVEADANRSLADSHDRREAIRSFVERREPVYRGD
jgi:enoyl-CoA hydratase/carnithine racemase